MKKSRRINKGNPPSPQELKNKRKSITIETITNECRIGSNNHRKCKGWSEI